jgi:predicted enzyme related to lactoylglutathione lyase
MGKNVNLIVFPVKDLASAKTLYNTLLGVEPYTDSAWYVGYRIGDQEIGLDPNGHRIGMDGPAAYWQVDDIRKSLQSLQQAGAKTLREITDVGGGLLVAMLKDADGNIIGLRQMP